MQPAVGPVGAPVPASSQLPLSQCLFSAFGGCWHFGVCDALRFIQSQSFRVTTTSKTSTVADTTSTSTIASTTAATTPGAVSGFHCELPHPQ